MASVARSLPPEIVCQVLKHFSASLVFPQCVAQFPFYLGHICSAWRAAFLSMHSHFWSTMILQPGMLYSVDKTHGTEMVKTFLQRSQGRPLSLELDRSLDGTANRFLEMFVKESTRWKNIALDVYRQDVQLLSLVKDRLPQLRSLTIYSATPRSLGGCKDFFENAPRLTHVRLNDLTNLRLPWQSLTALHLCGEVWHDKLVTDVLPQTANLEELFFSPATRPNDNFPAVVVTLPRLKNLFISEAFTLLFVIRTPSLEQTYLEDSQFGASFRDPSEDCKAFFLRSPCPLRRLGLGHCRLQTLAAILPHTPEIISLNFFHLHSQDSPNFFHLLTCVSEEASLAPRLETLRLSPPHATDSGFARMIASRTTDRPARVQRLKQFTLQLWAEGPDTACHITNAFDRECTSHDVQFQVNVQEASDIESSYRDFRTHNSSELGLFDV